MRDTSSPSPVAEPEAVRELRKACRCLYIAVDKVIADDVSRHAEAVIALLPATPASSDVLTSSQINARFISAVRRAHNAWATATRVGADFGTKADGAALATAIGEAITALNDARRALPPADGPKLIRSDVSLAEQHAREAGGWDVIRVRNEKNASYLADLSGFADQNDEETAQSVLDIATFATIWLRDAIAAASSDEDAGTTDAEAVAERILNGISAVGKHHGLGDTAEADRAFITERYEQQRGEGLDFKAAQRSALRAYLTMVLAPARSPAVDDETPTAETVTLLERVADKLTSLYYARNPGVPLGAGKNDPDVDAVLALARSLRRAPEATPDTKRIDFLESDPHSIMYYGANRWQIGDWAIHPTLREAIDEARFDVAWANRARRHNHGVEDGAGLLCKERIAPGGYPRGECLNDDGTDRHAPPLPPFSARSTPPASETRAPHTTEN